MREEEGEQRGRLGLEIGGHREVREARAEHGHAEERLRHRGPLFVTAEHTGAAAGPQRAAHCLLNALAVPEHRVEALEHQGGSWRGRSEGGGRRWLQSVGGGEEPPCRQHSGALSGGRRYDPRCVLPTQRASRKITKYGVRQYSACNRK